MAITKTDTSGAVDAAQAKADAAQTKIKAEAAQVAEPAGQSEPAAQSEPAGQSEPTEPTEQIEQIDYMSQIGGNLNLHNATEIFGGKNAVKAMQAYAMHGGHGALTEGDFTSPLFGGLGAPSAKDTNRIEAINSALNNLQ